MSVELNPAGSCPLFASVCVSFLGTSAAAYQFKGSGPLKRTEKKTQKKR
jgi:hypothetical protein